MYREWTALYDEVTTRMAERSMTLHEHLDYLRRPIVKKHFKVLIIILHSLEKKLLANEGLTSFDDI